MPDHRFAQSAEVHEPKHITSATTADAGQVITPSSSSSGVSQLRRLSLSDLSDGDTTITESDIDGNDKFNYQGWEMVEDALSTTPTITVDTTDTHITFDDEGVSNNTNSDYLPASIRGTGNLFDTVSSEITPIAEGDTYIVRVNVRLTNAQATPGILTCKLDTGTGSVSSAVMTEDVFNISKPFPHDISFVFPIYADSSLVDNGGRIFMQTDTGTLDVADRSIFIIRTGSGNI